MFIKHYHLSLCLSKCRFFFYCKHLHNNFYLKQSTVPSQQDVFSYMLAVTLIVLSSIKHSQTEEYYCKFITLGDVLFFVPQAVEYPRQIKYTAKCAIKKV